MPKRLLIKMLMLVSVVLVSFGCGTITPQPIEEKEKRFDASTPSQYDGYSSGFLGFTENDRGQTDGVLITNNAAKKYNLLIEDYAIQFREAVKVVIQKGDGMKDYIDVYGNQVHWIDAEHYAYFMKLNRWRQEERDPDTIWAKLKNKI